MGRPVTNPCMGQTTPYKDRYSWVWMIHFLWSKNLSGTSPAGLTGYYPFGNTMQLLLQNLYFTIIQQTFIFKIFQMSYKNIFQVDIGLTQEQWQIPAEQTFDFALDSSIAWPLCLHINMARRNSLLQQHEGAWHQASVWKLYQHWLEHPKSTLGYQLLNKVNTIWWLPNFTLEMAGSATGMSHQLMSFTGHPFYVLHVHHVNAVITHQPFTWRQVEEIQRISDGLHGLTYNNINMELCSI